MPDNSVSETSLGETPQRQPKRADVARNVLFNWGGMCGEAVVGFLLLPLLVARLGDIAYGLWVIIGSMTGFFLLLDLGMRASVGRFVALHRAQDDFAAINRVVSTSLAFLSVIGAVSAIAVLGFSWGYENFVDIPPNLSSSVRWAFAFVALNLALWFVLQTFDAVLWGNERFDLINLTNVPFAFLRLGLCILWIHVPEDLWKLGVITLVMSLVSGAAKAWLAMRQDRRMNLSWSYVNLASGKELYGYGVWNFLISVASIVKRSMIPIVIGAVIGPASVTLYAIARRLVDYAGMFINAASGVLTPVAAGNHARGDEARQRTLIVSGSKYLACLVLYFVIGEFALGGAFIKLWVGDDFSPAKQLLFIILWGEIVGFCNSVLWAVLLGAAKHRAYAFLSFADLVFSTGLGALGGTFYGLTGFVAGVAISTFVFSGAGLMIYACFALRISIREFVLEAWAAPLLAATLPITLIGLYLYEFDVQSWTSFILAGAIYTVGWGVAAMCVFPALRVPIRRWPAVLRG